MVVGCALEVLDIVIYRHIPIASTWCRFVVAFFRHVSCHCNQDFNGLLVNNVRILLISSYFGTVFADGFVNQNGNRLLCSPVSVRLSVSEQTDNQNHKKTK